MIKDELDLIRELNVSDQEKLQVFKETKFKELEEETNQVRITEEEKTKRFEIEHKTFRARIENNTSRLNKFCECITGCIDDYIGYRCSEEEKRREQEEMLNQIDFSGLSDENKPAFKVS